MRQGHKTVYLYGIAFFLIGSLVAGFSIALILLGINAGIMYSNSNYVIVNSLPTDKKGIGFGLYTSNAYFSYSIGIALTGFILSTASYAYFKHWSANNSIYHSLQNNAQVLPYISGARPLNMIAQATHTASPGLLQAGERAFNQGFATINWLFVAFSALGLLLSSRITKNQPGG